MLHGLEWMPFILATGQQIHLSLARILEALIIALVTGGIALWGANLVLETKIDQSMLMYSRDHQITMEWRKHIQSEIDANRERIYTLKEKSHEP